MAACYYQQQDYSQVGYWQGDSAAWANSAAWQQPAAWGQPQTACAQPAQPAQQGFFINLDDYTDDSDSDDEQSHPSAAPVTKCTEAKVMADIQPLSVEVQQGEPAAEPSPSVPPAPIFNVQASCCTPSTPADKVSSRISSSSSEPDAELDELKTPSGGYTVHPITTVGSHQTLPCTPVSSTGSVEECSYSVERASAPSTPGTNSVSDLLTWRRAAPAAPQRRLFSAVVTDEQHSQVASRQPSSAQGQRLRPSANSWSQQRTSSVDDDVKVLRSIKSILNKLTVEKFNQLYGQLLSCGIATTGHVECLIQELFEKATTQHHFIDLYADMCVLLHEHFAANPISDDTKFNFKRLLLNQCQASFERYIVPPADIKGILDFEERTLAENRYKTKMLGNMKFVGALLTRRMLASKIMFAICQELINDPTPEALESIGALLTVVGPTFDREEFSGRMVLASFFVQLKAIIQKPSIEARAKCLVQDLLDLRASAWKSHRPQRIEGPMTLRQVAQRAAAEDKWDNWGSKSIKQPWAPAVYGVFSQQQQQQQHQQQQQQQQQQQLQQKLVRVQTPSQVSQLCTTSFDLEAFRSEVKQALRELRHSSDENGAATRLAQQPMPPTEYQAAELSAMLAEIAQESVPTIRQAGFRLAVGLFSSIPGSWEPTALAAGLLEFVEQASADLLVDVPALPNILKEELLPALAALQDKRLVPEAVRKALLLSA